MGIEDQLGIYVRTHVLHRAHEPRSTCIIDLIETKLLLRASCMRQGRPRREDPSSELIRLTLFCSSITTWLNNYRVEIPVFAIPLTLCRCLA
jgi:hypothetical protein